MPLEHTCLERSSLKISRCANAMYICFAYLSLVWGSLWEVCTLIWCCYAGNGKEPLVARRSSFAIKTLYTFKMHLLFSPERVEQSR